MRQYNLTSKQELVEIIHACIDQEKFNAAIKLIEFVQRMEQEHRDNVLIEIR